MTALAGKGDAAGQDARTPRCIVWLAPDGQAPRPLLAGLERRAVRVVLAANAPEVMRQLAAAPALTIITIEPTRQPHLRELCEAVARYYPRTHWWQYEAQPTGGAPALAPMRESGVQTSQDEDAAVSGATPPEATDSFGDPERRNTQDAPDAQQDEAEDHQEDDDDQSQAHLASLTSEELAMLLGDDEEPNASAHG